MKKELVKQTENSPESELKDALKKAIDYGYYNARSPKVMRAYHKKAKMLEWRGTTPDGVRVMYEHCFDKKTRGTYTYAQLIVEGSEGDSFVLDYTGDRLFIIHSHAINRYIERRKYDGSLEDAQRNIIANLTTSYIDDDKYGIEGVDNQKYIYFDDGVFLCNYDGNILHVRTYITNSQCHLNQRLISLHAEKAIKDWEAICNNTEMSEAEREQRIDEYVEKYL